MLLLTHHPEKFMQCIVDLKFLKTSEFAMIVYMMYKLRMYLHTKIKVA
jgi:hypothetical protein